MANLKNINFMSKARFDSTTTSDEELYLVDYGDIDVVVESYVNGTEWYRVYKSGWIEQGGQTSSSAGSTERTVTFKKAFANTNYSLLLQGGSGGSSGRQYNSFQWTNKTTTNFKARAECTESIVMNWYACGQGA